MAGIPVDGVADGWIISPEDEGAHDRDERFPVKALSDDVDHRFDMISTLAG